MNKFKTIYDIITTREVIAIILLITLLVVGPIYGAYKDGYFYKNSDNPSHVLIRLLNKRARHLYNNLQNNSSMKVLDSSITEDMLSDIMKIGDNINNVIKILDDAGFKIIQEATDGNSYTFKSSTEVLLLPYFGMVGWRVEINIVSNDGETVANIFGWIRPPRLF